LLIADNYWQSTITINQMTFLYKKIFSQTRPPSVKECGRRKLYINFFRGNKMSLKRKFVSSLGVAAVAAAFSVVSFAQDTTTTAPTAPTKMDRKGKRGGDFAGRGMDRRHGKRGGLMRGFHDLNLTDAQKAQIKSIHQANKPDQTLRTELRTIHEARKSGQALTADQQNRLKAIREQRATNMRSVHEQILNVLTAEQKATLETRKTETHQRFENRKRDRKNRPAAPAVDKPKTI
jgi:Spy/CpxP family protein refolding chaperone